MNDNDVVIVSAVRTPFGRFGGVLRDFSSIDLGVLVIKEVLKRANVEPAEVEETYYGTCMAAESALENGIPARQATLLAGFPGESFSITLDRACCASLSATGMGFRSIKYVGDIDIALAVGSENMSHTPFLIPSSIRWGIKVGEPKMQDSLFGMGNPRFTPVSKDAGEVALEHGITREDQDKWAVRSQQRYAKAKADGKYKVGEELMAVEIPQRRGDPILFQEDEFPKPKTTIENLAKLPLVYGSPTVTAGNAPGLDTGASAILIMSRKKAEDKGLKPLATILSIVDVSMDHRFLAAVPAPAISKAVEKAGITLDDLSLIEINEAFAAMPLVASKILIGDDEKKLEEFRGKTNVNGGAIAIGHPVGASGARILMTLMYELRRRGGGYGVCAICGGLAQGAAAVIKVE